MNCLKLLSAAALLTATLPLTASSSLAQGWGGPGPCTPPSDHAVGAAGPAMSGGQLMAGVGQCGRIAGSGWRNTYGYYGYRGYAGPGWGGRAYAPGYTPGY
jgi:hypothetical protein